MKIGYAFWGHLADLRTNSNGSPISAPNGNATYSWAIINELYKRGHQIYRMMPNRDEAFVGLCYNAGVHPFAAFCKEQRQNAYLSLASYNEHEMPDLDLLLLEWRMAVTGRNTADVRGLPIYEPDLEIQYKLLKRYRGNAKIVALDLDYAMLPEHDKLVDYVLELGFKRGPDHHVEIPFDFSRIHDFPVDSPRSERIIYVGNRYNRDDMVDKYLVKARTPVTLYGNWLEGERDSVSRWPNIEMKHRVHPGELRDCYKVGGIAPLLLKPEYNLCGFMTARIWESAFFGAMPALPIEFRSSVKYLPEELIIHNNVDLENLARKSVQDPDWYFDMLTEVRNRLWFMDAKYFADKLLSV